MEEMRKITKDLRTASSPAEIRTKNLLNTGHRYRYTLLVTRNQSYGNFAPC